MLIRKSVVAVILLVGCGVASYFISDKLPTSFVPDEDQGYFYLNIQLPNAASLQRTELVTAKVEDMLAKTPGVRYTTSILGFSLLSLVRTSYNAFIFVTMKDWDDRKTRAEQFQAIKARLEPASWLHCRKAWRSASRRRRFPESALRADSLSSWKTGPARTSSFCPTT